MLNYLDFFTGIIAIYLTVLFFRKRNNDLLIAEKYKNLIFPMFHMLEPYLYKTVNLEIKTTLKKLTVLHENNILYSSPNLIEAIKSCTPISKCSNEDYICLCKQGLPAGRRKGRNTTTGCQGGPGVFFNEFQGKTD